MKINSTVVLTFGLLFLMLTGGAVSALVGFNLGDDALKGVTQPDVNPSKNLSDAKKKNKQGKGFTIIPEKTILKEVNIYIQNKSKSKSKSTKKDDKSSFIDEEGESLAQSPEENETSEFPIKGEAQGVILEVIKASQQGASLQLDVNLKNTGTRAVKFLYSFLDVRDNEGRSLGAITDGLPGEVPANGTNYHGTISIPMALLDNIKNISLSLTDYPEQQLEIKVAQIPVER